MSGIDTNTPVRKRRSMSKAMQVSIFRRDGWLCRWCRKPVIFAPVFRYVERFVRASGATAELAYHHKNWSRQKAPLLDELGAVIDHVKAHSTGGPDSVENLVTACNKCNGQKSASSAAMWGEQPRKFVKGKYGEPVHWDGLSILFIMLARTDTTALTGSEREWLVALSSEGSAAA